MPTPAVPLHQIGNGFDRLVRVHDQRHRRGRDQRNRREVAHGVIRQLAIKGRVDRVRADSRHQKRLPIGDRPRDGVGPDRAARAATIIDHDRRLERFAQHLRQRPGDDVGRTTGRERHHEADLLAGERLRARDTRVRQELRAGRRAGGNFEKASAVHQVFLAIMLRPRPATKAIRTPIERRYQAR